MSEFTQSAKPVDLELKTNQIIFYEGLRLSLGEQFRIGNYCWRNILLGKGCLEKLSRNCILQGIICCETTPNGKKGVFKSERIG
jgi:hypothetical protein